MPGRDLNIQITGDASDFDRALDRAAEEARELDRELGKAERQQKAFERQQKVTAAAIKEFGTESGKAAQQARLLGMAAQKAAQQAERAQIRAAAAARDAAEGRGSEERAARLAADAQERVARAALKAADAHRAAAAAEEAATDATDEHRAALGGMRGGLVSAGAAAASLAPLAGAAGLAFAGFAAMAAPAVTKVVAAQQDLAGSWSTLNATQRATSVHMNNLINDYKNLAASYEPQALGAFNGLLSTASQVMARSTPLFDAGAAGVGRFTGRVEDFVTSGTMNRFLGFAAREAPGAFDQLGTTFQQTGTLALNLVQDLAPMGMSLLTAANSGLRLLNMVEQIDPRLVEFGVAAMALRGPTTALSGAWTSMSGKLGRFGREAQGASRAARGMGVATKALNAGMSAGPNLYVGAALAATYLTARWWSAKDALDKNIDAIKVENNAFGNNIEGHRLAAQAIGEESVGRTTYNAQVARSAKAARDEVKAGHVNINTFARVRRARQEELDAIKAITAGQNQLAKTYGISATQANQLATAAGVDLSRSMDKSGNLTKAAAAKIRQYVAAAKAASDPTRVIAQALDAVGNSGLQLKDRMAALDTAFNALAGPTIGAFDATTKAASAFDQLDAAMRKSHGSMSLQTDAGRAARGAFAQMVMGVEANIKAQYQLDSVLYGAGRAAQNMAQNVKNVLPLMLAQAGKSKQAQNAVLAYAKSHGIAANSVGDLYNKLGTTHSQFIANAMAMGKGRKEAERMWRAFQKLKPVKLKADDRDFLVKLRRAQGLKIDPKTGLFKGNNAHYFNKWLKSKGLRLDPKTGRFLGNHADYYNHWFKANRLKIDPKTGRIKGDSAAFWRAVHSIPQVVATRTIRINLSKGYMHIPRGIGATKADGGIMRYADGGIARYAEGGMRRDLPAFITPQPTVLFGETQTGGEAYIPLSPAKRTRSTQILETVAREFGLTVAARVPVAPSAAVPMRGGDGASARPISQTINVQSADPHVIARESARELAWTMR